jgi:hypothetical protein
MEEMLISPIHALLQVWQVRGGQTKYAGHCCNFPRDVAILHNRLPLLPRDTDVVILRHKAMADDLPVFEDFRVRREPIRQWLEKLSLHHPSFTSGDVVFDPALLGTLPEDANVFGDLRSIEQETVDFADPADPVDEQGPGQGEPALGEGEPIWPVASRGFVPNVRPDQSELDNLLAVLPGTQTLTFPALRSTPLSEHQGIKIAIGAFPTLFPTGKADFQDDRPIKPVTMKEWAAHLIRYKDGRFAQHPRFRYWVLNTIMRHDAKAQAKWYLTTHKGQQRWTVENIREMIQENRHKDVADRVA